MPYDNRAINVEEVLHLQREKFSSRLGFLLISAGCAIGLGNVWRFPYITGQYGGAAFVLIYLFFLVVLGLPIMVMEFSVGRASQKSAALSFHVLEPKGTKWHWYSYGAMAGNYLLMMFYTTVCGWMIIYFFKMAAGEFSGKNPEEVGAVFNAMLAQPILMTICMITVVLIGFGVCSMGLKNGVERITKVMMSCLLVVILCLVVRSVTLPGASEGLRFYLMPDFSKISEQGAGTVIYAAMGQAFFTLSLGIGAMAIFGSYIGRDRSLTGESINITLLDTFVALMSGLVIFPACSAFQVDPGQGPGLVFITLPNIFNAMPGGRLWGSLFFMFLTFSAFSTIIAVFENIVSFAMDLWHWPRKKAVLFNIAAIILLSMPCVLGFNLWSDFAPFGAGSTIQDLEDFIISNNLLPIGSLIYLLFCTSRYGWGWKNFLAEADQGDGIKFPAWTRCYVSYILPLIVLVIFLQGYNEKFQLLNKLSALFH
ncbi:sodium-dependent transporter [Anaerotruncus rubiinfantis]|uniref:sodium-dependent transporter n=1 Tax=Anaerotruncus rubiinfantis TaxID=1720200 RepID=UPI00189B7FD2